MQTVKIVVWQEEDVWIGYLQEYPDYRTQGDSRDDLEEHLKDLHADLSAGLIQGARKVEDLTVS
ncbi:MAG: type II toxin-antitoxin system HicB family antitoxin [Planctomycetaceae bacterium]|mgnify:CR=1 FL=1|jgi:predicted RNase H-like HicB family nuclease|nr:type II toxin-antitoxin system HicB family antitoxin [Planctomycetaceae bacterium]MBT6157583.1 type II toxin-antitoxin system HicB family antitoxin [Planctomycetaceae bacterium]MBT6486064.1 type II toxin-antitoxin system HicB family antitoxin [Planctomycetaceae bacterium]MBT6497846.1 type II toxin-antitoxin system HicB family antitoxin [Planctomycetaceae bacterium]